MTVTTGDRDKVSRLFSLAWQKAVSDGASDELIAGTALSAALASLVQIHGQEAAARMTERFAVAIREGRFSHVKDVDLD